MCVCVRARACMRACVCVCVRERVSVLCMSVCVQCTLKNYATQVITSDIQLNSGQNELEKICNTI